MYDVAASAGIITYASGKNGVIETESETKSSFKKFIFEVLELNDCYSVAIQLLSYERELNKDGSYSEWNRCEYWDKNIIINDLKVKVCERLNGRISVSQELQDRVDAFNAMQNSERKKIKFGIDY